MLAADYAKALWEMKEKPNFSHLRTVLERRGHLKLLSQIFAEYQKLLLRDERRERQEKITPEQERTGVLLELYRKLTRTN